MAELKLRQNSAYFNLVLVIARIIVCDAVVARKCFCNDYHEVSKTGDADKCYT